MGLEPGEERAAVLTVGSLSSMQTHSGGRVGGAEHGHAAQTDSPKSVPAAAPLEAGEPAVGDGRAPDCDPSIGPRQMGKVKQAGKEPPDEQDGPADGWVVVRKNRKRGEM